MKFENQSLRKLKSITEFIKTSGKFLFQNYNLKVFLNFLEKDPEISIIINSLLSRNTQIERKLHKLQSFDNFKLNEVRSTIKTFEEQVSYCLFYLKISIGSPNFIENFINPADGSGADEKNKDIFYNECITPIILYIELEINNSVSALHALKRYKVLCEWHDRKELLSMQNELEITKGHLSKHLFYSGFFNYSLYEVNVPSGRIDNLALRIDSDNKRQAENLPNVILAEGKFFRNKKSVRDVFNQVDKRMRDLNLHEGFCVIFNKENKKLHIIGASGEINGVYFRDINNARIYFLTIDLHGDFYNSTKTLEKMEIDVSAFISVL